MLAHNLMTTLTTDGYMNFHVTHHTSHTHMHTQVLKRSQYLLLQTASPDALVRLEQSPLTDQKEELLELYFQQQHHNSLEDFLAHHLQRNGTRGESLLMQVGWLREEGRVCSCRWVG